MGASADGTPSLSPWVGSDTGKDKKGPCKVPVFDSKTPAVAENHVTSVAVTIFQHKEHKSARRASVSRFAGSSHGELVGMSPAAGTFGVTWQF